MAALRAPTMATTIQSTCHHQNGCVRHASSAPVSANGSANTEWLKRTNERDVRTLVVVVVDTRHGIRRDTGREVFFHVVYPFRHTYGNQRRTLAGLEAAVLRIEPEC